MLIASDPAGYRPLRQEIAAYLGASRGLRCEADQIVVVNGTLQAVNLAARVCINRGEEAWFEHPGYPSAWRALADAGARLVSVARRRARDSTLPTGTRARRTSRFVTRRPRSSP